MKIKLDENIPHRLSPVLTSLGHDVRTVVDQRLTGRPDDVIWRAVAGEARLLVTQDVEFGRLASGERSRDAGVLLLRLRAPGRSALLRRVRSLFETENVSRWRGCVIVATDRKIRLRRT